MKLKDYEIIKNFLNYPVCIKPHSLGLGRDVRGYIISMSDDKHWEKEKRENLFAILDDRCTSEFLKCTVTLPKIGAEFTFYGLNRFEEAEALIDVEYEKYKAINFPEGLHWVECEEGEDEYLSSKVGLYFGKMRLARFRRCKGPDKKVDYYHVAIDEMHHSKFFADSSEAEDLLNGKVVFSESLFDDYKKSVDKLIDLDRYEANKKAKEEEKQVEQQANNMFLGLPELSGTEKQIKWANDIRMKFVQAIGVDTIASKQWKKTSHKAKFWIDNREKSLSELLTLSFLK